MLGVFQSTQASCWLLQQTSQQCSPGLTVLQAPKLPPGAPPRTLGRSTKRERPMAAKLASMRFSRMSLALRTSSSVRVMACSNQVGGGHQVCAWPAAEASKLPPKPAGRAGSRKFGLTFQTCPEAHTHAHRLPPRPPSNPAMGHNPHCRCPRHPSPGGSGAHSRRCSWRSRSAPACRAGSSRPGRPGAAAAAAAGRA